MIFLSRFGLCTTLLTGSKYARIINSTIKTFGSSKSTVCLSERLLLCRRNRTISQTTKIRIIAAARIG